MRIENEIQEDYFEWMYAMMCEGRFAPSLSYRKLFEFLHEVEFIYFIPHDENRAKDGMSLRYKFCLMNNCPDLEEYLDGPCSVLEMMVALSIKCEHIKSDPRVGDRTAQWFWGMMSNLGLSSMNDRDFNDWYVNDVVTRFLNREYDRNGRGGLFTIRRWKKDARDVEIWHQLLAYLNTID